MYIASKRTQTALVTFLNKSSRFKKKNGNLFTVQDVQGYCRRGYLPKHLGGYPIEKDNSVKGVKLYNIIDNNNSELHIFL